ncbi:MAG: metalloregulator ArsR/SmtB family transcription factor [Verrucomicrobiota bacterium]
MPKTTSKRDSRVTVIKALAHPTRLQLAEALRGDGVCCVGELHARVGGDLSTVSKHLSLMRDAGWIKSEKRGLHIHYSLACDCLGEFLRCVDQLAATSNKENCC